MRSAHSVPEVRRAEQALMATLPEGTLMQRAAAGLAARCTDLLDGTYGRRVALLVGAGDNGGDTLYAGARLARRGARVDAVLLAPDKAHPGGLAALRAAGGGVADGIPPGADLVLDGIVGIGGKPGLRPEAASQVETIERLGVPVVAVDAPSGIDVDTGETPQAHVRADVTVTFGTHKIGLLAPPAAAAAGVVDLVDIGLGPWLDEPAMTALQADDVSALLPEPPLAAHKYTRGVVGVAAGSTDYTGAGLLAVAGASCGLAGMVRYAGPVAVADLVRLRTPEAVVGAGRVQAWVVGSGGGESAPDALRRALADGVPVVVDADALDAVPDRFEGPAILTPHAGELAELLSVERSDVESRPLHYVQVAADRWDATVLLKGWRTLVATPGRPVAVNPTGVPWLATAGAGDVLAGLIGALAAAGLSAHDAARVGAWLHGAAATVAGAGGPLVASGVADALPEVIRGLGPGGD
ncbi:MAG TPA: NAD(P)H-hydrate dehydratase [Nocardioidaceae bacterium]|nr:NAD(P)H-hydrate dehydratase [Nocardioidaceae bacterium]